MMRFNLRLASLVLPLAGAIALAPACSSDDVSSEEDARIAYLGLHRMIDRALNMGMAGYNEASSANIPTQERTGDVTGTITITGQVDQGVSPNKEMRLDIDLVEYRDDILVEGDLDAGLGVAIVYDTDPEETAPRVELSLRNIPDGTFTGTLRGSFLMTGDLEGRVTLDLQLSGDIEEVPNSEGDIRRVPGSTTVSGSAESRYGVFDVDLVL
jgi:hypothetical protein